MTSIRKYLSERFWFIFSFEVAWALGIILAFYLLGLLVG